MITKLLLSLIFSILFSDSEYLTKEQKYFGGWPKFQGETNNLPNAIIDCPGETGCSCIDDTSCINNNCIKMPRGKYCTPQVGDKFPNFTALDQYGEEVSIYDFSNNGKYILLEMGATWCTPCRELADWFSYNNEAIFKQRWFKEEYTIINEMIHEDQLYYITILYEDSNKDNVTYDTLYDWFLEYPDEKIPVLADSEKFLHSWIKPTGLPTILLLNEKMEIVVFTNRGVNAAFDKILELVKNEK